MIILIALSFNINNKTKIIHGSNLVENRASDQKVLMQFFSIQTIPHKFLIIRQSLFTEFGTKVKLWHLIHKKYVDLSILPLNTYCNKFIPPDMTSWLIDTPYFYFCQELLHHIQPSPFKSSFNRESIFRPSTKNFVEELVPPTEISLNTLQF